MLAKYTLFHPLNITEYAIVETKLIAKRILYHGPLFLTQLMEGR